MNIGGFSVVGKLIVDVFLLRKNVAFRCIIVILLLYLFIIFCGRIRFCFVNPRLLGKTARL